MTVPNVILNNGDEMPILGFGVYQIPPEDTERCVADALEVGYRHIDTAAAYGNERAVGRAVAASGLPRDEVFVTTKLWIHNSGEEGARRQLEKSLERLGVERIDLYLIHQPFGDVYASWRAMQRALAEGLVRSIGVSNFLPEHLDRIIEATGVVPAVNQIELHPRFQQRAARAYHEAKGIVTQSWSPLGQGGELLKTPQIVAIADKHGRSAAQVVLAWHLAHGLSAIPKAADAAHMADNFTATDLTLDAEDMAAIDALDDVDGRIGPDPANMGT